MTGLDAWSIISANMQELYHYRAEHGRQAYTDEEVEVEVMCYMALKKTDEEKGVE